MELMFPTAQTALASPAPAPSLADIVREKTQGGRLIVRFFLSTMEGEFEDARVHHRVDAAKQLVILQHNSSFSDVVRDETDNGDRIISFLFSVMMGEIEGARQHHRNEAGKQLARLDPLMARALAEDNIPRRSRPLHTGAVGAPSHSLHATGAPLLIGAVGAGVGTPLDEIVRQETNDGRDIVRFYADVMRGVLTDFKTHQRMDAADKLVSLSSDHTPCVPAPQPAARQPASDHDTVSAATPWKTPRKPEWRHFEYPRRPHLRLLKLRRRGLPTRPLRRQSPPSHIRRRRDQERLQPGCPRLQGRPDRGPEGRRPLRPRYLPALRPLPELSGPRSPDDDSFGRHTYGYNALVYIYSDKATARVGYMGAMDHKEKLRIALIAADAHAPVDHDHPGNGPDPPPKPRKPRSIAYF